MMNTLSATALALALLAAPAFAQAAAPPAPAPVSKDPAAATAGTYKLDPNHTSVVARVSHAGGFSYSTFRFGKSGGTLTWDPARVENTKVEITVDPGSIMTPVANFAEELAGDKFLNAAKFPDAKFVSTSVRRTGPTTGQITGNLTFMGQTKPVTIDAEMIGAGKNMRGVSTIGFSGKTRFKRSDFGFNAMQGPIGDEVELLIDGEFNQG
jgi:polyisoprenoid-binding protein YceI